MGMETTYNFSFYNVQRVRVSEALAAAHRACGTATQAAASYNKFKFKIKLQHLREAGSRKQAAETSSKVRVLQGVRWCGRQHEGRGRERAKMRLGAREGSLEGSCSCFRNICGLRSYIRDSDQNHSPVFANNNPRVDTQLRPAITDGWAASSRSAAGPAAAPRRRACWPRASWAACGTSTARGRGPCVGVRRVRRERRVAGRRG